LRTDKKLSVHNIHSHFNGCYRCGSLSSPSIYHYIVQTISSRLVVLPGTRVIFITVLVVWC